MRQMRLLLPARDAPHHRMLYFVHLHPQCNYAALLATPHSRESVWSASLVYVGFRCRTRPLPVYPY